MNTRTDTADEVAYLIQHIALPLQARRDQYNALQLEIAGLEQQGICNGTVYWRNDGTPKLYINHSIDQSCPIHGDPAPGERIRHYVGTKQDRQAEAQAAIERWKQHQRLLKEKRLLAHALRRATRTLQDIYHSLGFNLPNATTAPTPRPNWTPGTFRRSYATW